MYLGPPYHSDDSPNKRQRLTPVSATEAGITTPYLKSRVDAQQQPKRRVMRAEDDSGEESSRDKQALAPITANEVNQAEMRVVVEAHLRDDVGGLAKDMVEREDDIQAAKEMELQQVKCHPFLEEGHAEAPEILYFREDFDLRVLQQLVGLHGDKKNSFEKYAAAMIKYQKSGKLATQYEQKGFKEFDPEGFFQSKYRIGRYFSKYPRIQRLVANTHAT